MESRSTKENSQWNKLSFRIAAIYAVVGALWIFFSDRVAAMFSGTPEAMTRISTIKGWLYVLCTALLLHCLVRHGVRELSRSQTAFRLSEEKYREVVQRVNSIILQIDCAGRITFFNEFAQTFFGYGAEEILGRNVVGTIVPETDSAGRDLTKMVRDIAAYPELYENNQNENMLRNGNRVWIAWANSGDS